MSKEQINLPKTAFSMKANLPIKEPDLIKYWSNINLYKQLRDKSKGQKKFVLHDGPPYANGNIHMGTALNKILKDIVTKFFTIDFNDKPSISACVKSSCEDLKLKFKDIGPLIRFATTGKLNAPSIDDLCFLLGKKRVIERISRLLEIYK